MDDSQDTHRDAAALGARRPWIALLLSLPVAGLGHLYAGRGRRGVILLLLAMAYVPVVYLLARLPPAHGVVYALVAVVVLTIGVMFFSLFDAFRVARSAERPYLRRPYNHIGLYVALIALTTMWSVMSHDFLKANAFEVYIVPTESMDPTIAPGDRVLVDKFPLGDFQRGDVIVFHYPHNAPRNFIKRLVGLSGERVRIEANGDVWINGVAALREPTGPEGRGVVRETIGRTSYLIRAPRPAVEARPPAPLDVVIPPHHVFVLGDNRDGSRDSRSFGPIPIGDIVGVASYVWVHRQGRLKVGTTD